MASERSKAASKATSKAAVKSTSSSSSSQYEAPLSANVSSVVDYDHEAYLQLVSGSGHGLGSVGSSSAGTAALGKKAAPKTANQVCREERTKHLTTRALDPAILEPRGDPSSVDFECAELQRKKDRFQ